MNKRKSNKPSGKDVIVTFRIPVTVFDFLDKYAIVKGISKKSILEDSVLELLKDFVNNKTLGIKVTDEIINMFKENVRKKVRAKSVSKGEKLVIYINKDIDDIVQAVSETIQIKPTDIYRMALIRFFNLHRHEELGDEIKTRAEKLSEILNEIYKESEAN